MMEQVRCFYCNEVTIKLLLLICVVEKRKTGEHLAAKVVSKDSGIEKDVVEF